MPLSGLCHHHMLLNSKSELIYYQGFGDWSVKKENKVKSLLSWYQMKFSPTTRFCVRFLIWKAWIFNNIWVMTGKNQGTDYEYKRSPLSSLNHYWKYEKFRHPEKAKMDLVLLTMEGPVKIKDRDNNPWVWLYWFDQMHLIRKFFIKGIHNRGIRIY